MTITTTIQPSDLQFTDHLYFALVKVKYYHVTFTTYLRFDAIEPKLIIFILSKYFVTIPDDDSIRTTRSKNTSFVFRHCIVSQVPIINCQRIEEGLFIVEMNFPFICIFTCPCSGDELLTGYDFIIVPPTNCNIINELLCLINCCYLTVLAQVSSVLIGYVVDDLLDNRFNIITNVRFLVLEQLNQLLFNRFHLFI